MRRTSSSRYGVYPPYEPYERCRSILGAAVDSRDLSCVQAVLKHEGYGSDLGKYNALCMTHAIESGELEIVQALVKARVRSYKAIVNATNQYAAAKNNALVLAGSQPDKFASSLGRFGLLRLVFGSLSSEEKTTESCIEAVRYTLEETCKHGDVEMFHLMIHVLKAPSGRMLCEASSSGNQQLVCSILQTGLDINEVCVIGSEHVAPLNAASKAGHVQMVQFLVLKGANPRNSWSPLVSAAASGHAPVVRTLLDCGADLEARSYFRHANFKWCTAMQAACQNGHLDVARLLIQNGAQINKGEDFRSDPPISFACRWGHEAIVKLLIEEGAKLDFAGSFGRIPLLCAIEYGRFDIARRLIESGADIDRTCERGRTALWRAAYCGNDAIARLLIDRRASVNISDKFGKTPLAAAKEQGHTDIVALLVENGAVEQLDTIP